VPELTAINDWALSNGITDPVEKRMKYRSYLTEEFLKEETLTPQVAQEINQATYDGLTQDGVEEPDQYFAAVEPTLEEKHNTVLNSSVSFGSKDEASVLRDYTALKQVVATSDTVSEETTNRLAALEEEATGVINNSYDNAKKKLLIDGVAPYARITDADGNVRIRGGEAATGLSTFDAYQKSLALGLVTEDDVLAVKQAHSAGEDGIQQFRKENARDVSSAISAIGNDEVFVSDISSLAESIVGEDSVAVSNAEDRIESAIQNVRNLVPAMRDVPDADIRAALDLQAGTVAMNDGSIELDDEDFTKNIRKFGYGDDVIHSALIVNESGLEQAMAGRSEEDKINLRFQRDAVLESSISRYKTVLADSYLSDEWLESLTAGLAAGKKEPEILLAFLGNEEYSAFKNEAIGLVGTSVKTSVTDVIYGIQALSGSEAGRADLLANQRIRNSRNELASMFGQPTGVVTDLSAMVAPIIFDVAATSLLAAGTAGTGAVAYVGMRAAAKTAARQMVKGLLKDAAGDSAVLAAQKLAVRNMITAGGKKFSGATVSQAYAKVVANKMVISSALFAPADVRSSSMTYATVYSALENAPAGKKMTAEEIHQKALAAGLIAGMITGVITVGFGLAGRAGLEGFLVGRATTKQVKEVMQRLAGRDLGDDVIGRALATTIAAGQTKVKQSFIKRVGQFTDDVQILKNFKDEAVEEGVDEFANTFVQANATGEEVKLKDLAQQVGMAAAYGGVFGAAMPLAQNTFGKITRRAGNIEAEALLASETSVANRVAAELKATGSPITAEAVLERMRNAPARRAAAAAAASAPNAAAAASAPNAAPTPTPVTPNSPAVASAAADSARDRAAADAAAAVVSAATSRKMKGLLELQEKIKRNNAAAAVDILKAKELVVLNKRDADIEKRNFDGANARLAHLKQAQELANKIKEDAGIPAEGDTPYTEEQLELDLILIGDIAATTEAAAAAAAEPDFTETDRLIDEEQMEIDFEQLVTSVSEQELNEIIEEVENGKQLMPANMSLPQSFITGLSPSLTPAMLKQVAADAAEEGKPVEETVEAVKRAVYNLTYNGDTQATLELDDLRRVPTTAAAVQEDVAVVEANDQELDFSVKPAVQLRNKMDGQSDALVETGALLRFSGSNYGMPSNSKLVAGGLIEFSNEHARKVYASYPPITQQKLIASVEPAKLDDYKLFDVGTTTRLDIESGLKPVKAVLKVYYSASAGMLFNNDPQSVARALKKGMFVTVPPSFDRKLLNPSIKTRANGSVYSVTEPAALNIAQEISIVDNTIEKKASGYNKRISKKLTFNASFKPPADTNITTLDFTIGGVEISNGLSTYAKVAAAVDSFFSKYSEQISGGDSEGSVAAHVGKLLKLSGETRADATAELHTEFSEVIRLLALKQDLTEKNLVTQATTGTYTLEEGAYARVAEYFTTSEIASTKLSGSPVELVATTDIEKAAVAIYANGYATTKTPINSVAPIGKKNRKLVANWAEVIIAHYVDTNFRNDVLVNKEATRSPNIMRLVTRPAKALKERADTARDKVLTGSAVTVAPIDEVVLPENFVVTTYVAAQAALAGDATKHNDVLAEVAKALMPTVATGALSNEKFMGFMLQHIKDESHPDLDLDAAIGVVDGLIGASQLPKEVLRLLRLAGLRTRATDSEPDVALLDSTDISNSLDAPNVIADQHRAEAREANTLEVARLQLVSGDPASVIAALQQIMKSSTSESHRLVAKLLLNDHSLIRNTQFVINDDVTFDPAGVYDEFTDGSTRVTLNLSGYFGNGIESVLLHEYLHAVTYKLLHADPATLSTKQRAARARLNGLLTLMRKEYSNSDSNSLELNYALTNIDELVAMIFTSNSVQNAVRQLPTAGFLRRIINALKDLFGIAHNSPLAKAFNDLVDLVEMGNAGHMTSVYGQIDAAIAYQADNKPVRPAFLASRADKVARYSSFEALSVGSPATEQEGAALDDLISDAVRDLIPSGVLVSVVDNATQAGGAFDGRPEAGVVATLILQDGVSRAAIFINRSKMRQALHEKSSLLRNRTHAAMILEAVIAEEVAHITEFNTVSAAELDNFAATLAPDEFDAIIEEYTDNVVLRAQLREGLAAGNREVQHQIIGEKLRMHLQRVTRGTTTEQDIAFWSSSPNFMRVALRYLSNVFRRIYAQYNLEKSNTELSNMVHRMSLELKYLSAGTYMPETRLAFDTRAPNAGFEILQRRFTAMMTEVTPDTTDEEIRTMFAGLFDTLQMPVGYFDSGGYKQNKWKRLKGALDPRIADMKKMEQAFQAGIDYTATGLAKKVMKLIDAAPEVDTATLQSVVGRADGIEPSAEFKAKLEADYVAERQRVVAAGTGWNAIKVAERDRLVGKKMHAETMRLIAEFKRTRSEAMTALSATHPELEQSLRKLRLLLDTISLKTKTIFGTDSELSATIDRNLGLYVTRAYKAFHEIGYIDRVLSRDGELAIVYDEAYAFFKKTYIDKTARKIKANEKAFGNAITTQESKDLALSDLNAYKIDQIHIAMADYLYAFDPKNALSGELKLPAGVSRSLIDNLKDLKNVPKEVRGLLGEYDDSQAVSNVLRSISIASRALARQNFYNTMITLGHQPDGEGFVLKHEEIAVKAAGDATFGNWVNLRTGNRFSEDSKQDVKGLQAKYDPTFFYYAPPDMIKDMRAQFAPVKQAEEMAAYEVTVEAQVGLVRTLTGASLSLKTLGSGGFYIRNIVGNLAWYQLGQGMFFAGYGHTVPHLREVYKAFKGNTERDAYTAELISLLVVGNDIHTNVLGDILDGKFNVQDAKKELAKLVKELSTIKGKSANALSTAGNTRDTIIGYFRRLSQSVDTFYKMGYFEHELAVLKAARAEDTTGEYKDLSDYDLKRLSAQKVRGTSQSYTDAPEYVKLLASRYGHLLAPFLRFRVDQIRIAINTPKLAYAELKSGNAVIRKRGAARMAGFLVFSVGFGTLGSILFNILSGIGAEEDDVLREGVPEWAKDHTFFYTKFGGELKSWDMTFMNPFASLTDPVSILVRNITLGKADEGFSEATRAFLGDYTTGQIFGTAVIDAISNRDSETGEKITHRESSVAGMWDRLTYTFDNAFMPRTPAALLEASKTAIYGVPEGGVSAGEKIMREFMPVRPQEVDIERIASNIAHNALEENRAARKAVNKLRTNKAMSDGEVEDLAGDYVKRSVAANSKVYNSMVVLEKFGLTRDKLVGLATGAGYSKTKIAEVLNGQTSRPMLTPDLIESVSAKGEIGVARVRVFNKKLLDYPRYVPLND